MRKQFVVDNSDRNHPVIREKTEKTYTNTDVERLYDAFTKICDYVEKDTKESCEKCPHRNICFGLSGNAFAESLKRIRESVK